MSSHFLFHSEASETVPMEARYSFPTQASRVVKSVVKIPPRSGVDMKSLSASAKGRLIQLTLPAQGYLNPLESYLRFDLTINSSNTAATNGITVDVDYQNRSGLILEGMGSDMDRASLHNLTTFSGSGTQSQDGNTVKAVNILAGRSTALWGTGSAATGTSSAPVLTHTYCLNLGAGLLTQQKLIPLKWLANQLTIELEIEEPGAFLVQGYTTAVNGTNDANSKAGFVGDGIPRKYSQVADAFSSTITYDLTNIYFNAEIL
ncbi:hypothetical protein M427DRAFT_39959, partial [Gonapodya prolifera JEL478]